MELHNKFQTLEEAKTYILKVLSDFINANTLFIVHSDGTHNTILKAFNQSEFIYDEEVTKAIIEAYCDLVWQSEEQAVIIPNISREPGVCSFIGVPIRTSTNDSYAICAMDHKSYFFSEKEAVILQAMATLLGYILALENTIYVDSLTNTYNRNFLAKYFMSLSPENLENLAVLFVDLDNFKKVNDSFGHNTGDMLLKDAAGRLRASVKKEDVVVRLGGDEFILLISYDTNEEIRQIADSIKEHISAPYLINQQPIGISVSIGISLYREGADMEFLIKLADQAMYRVKQNGKNNVMFG